MNLESLSTRASPSTSLYNATEKPVLKSEELRVSEGAIKILKSQFIVLSAQNKIKQLEILNYQNVTVCHENGKRIVIPTYLIELPVCTRAQLEKYVKHTFFKVFALSGGGYKITSCLRLLGGGNDTMKEIDKQLFQATEQGDLTKISALLKQGANLNATWVEYPTGYIKQGMTLMMLAASQGHQAIVEFFIKLGANPDEKSQDAMGYTATMFAIERGHLDLVKYLQKQSANLKGTLHLAILGKQLSMVKYLVSQGLKPNDPYGDETALDCAYIFGTDEITKYLESVDPGDKLYKAIAKSNYLGQKKSKTNTEAIEHFSNTLKLDPNNRKAYLFRASHYEDSKQYTKAIKDYEKLMELDPHNIEYHYRSRGKAKFGMGQYQEAIKDYEKALSLTKVWESNLYNLIGRANQALGEYKKALEYHEKATKSSHMGNVDMDRGFAKLGLGQNEEVIEICDEFIKNHNNLEYVESIYILRGQALSQLGRYEKALEDFKTFLSLKSDPMVHEMQADTLLLIGRCHGALKEAEAALNLSSSKVGAYALCGEALLSLGIEKDARKAFNNSISLPIEPPEPGVYVIINYRVLVYFWRARLAFHLNELDQAEKDVKEGLSFNRYSVDLHLLKGDIAAKNQSYELAMDAYNEAIKLNPPNAKELMKKRDEYKKQLSLQISQNNKSKVNDPGLFIGGNKSKDEIVQVDLKAAEKFYEEGLDKYELEEYQKAIKKFDQAIQADSQYSKAYFRRGRAKEALDDLLGAKQDYETSQKQNYEKAVHALEKLKLRLSEKKTAMAPSKKMEALILPTIEVPAKQQPETDKRQKLIDDLKKLDKARKEKTLLLSDTNKKYKELEPLAQQFQSMEFFTSRGYFYYEAAQAETNQTRRLAHYANAKLDFEIVLGYDSFAENIAEMLDEIEKQTKGVTAQVQNLTSISSVKPTQPPISIKDLSSEEQIKFEEYKKKLLQQNK